MTRKGQVDLVSSRVYPGLERSPGNNDNWVERAGGLPSYIERIAKHLHYEQGMPISRAIAVAVNTVKRWAKGGTVTAHGTTKRITPATQAKAAKAVAEWEAKKARGGVSLTREQKIAVIDLALTKDGRRSFKGQGKWKHGFVPVDSAAKKAKAKGSPIAARRVQRLFGDVSAGVQASKSGAQERTSTGRAATFRRALISDSKANQRLALNKNDREESRGGGIDARARKPWTELPESQKTVRNGKRYVMSVYKGQQQLVPWIGGGSGAVEGTDATRRVLRSLRAQDAAVMSTAQLRRLLKVPGQPDSVKKVLNEALRAKAKEAK